MTALDLPHRERFDCDLVPAVGGARASLALRLRLAALTRSWCSEAARAGATHVAGRVAGMLVFLALWAASRDTDAVGNIR
jgi:hypothetical protein